MQITHDGKELPEGGTTEVSLTPADLCLILNTLIAILITDKGYTVGLKLTQEYSVTTATLEESYP